MPPLQHRDSRSLWRAVAVALAIGACFFLPASASVIAPPSSGAPAAGGTASAPPAAAPRLIGFGFLPAAGAPDSSVIVSGTGFLGATKVTFDGVSAIFTVNSDDQIVATVPVGATSGKIAISTPAGTATSATDFTVEAAPAGAAYSVDDYGAAGNGTTDDSQAIQAAYDAAASHAADGSPATVAFTAGKTYFVSHPVILDAIRASDYWDPAIDAPRVGSRVARSGIVTLEGAGATIKYARNSARYCWLQGPKPTVAGNTYGNLVIDGFTIDHNERSPTAVCASVLWLQGAGNVDNVTITNVTTTANLTDHMDATDGNHPNRNVCGVSITGAGYPPHDNYFTNISVSDCNITAQSQSVCIVGNNKCVLDQLSVARCTTNNLGFAGSSMMFGGPGMGWHVSVTGCDCSNSDDDGVEIDGFNEVTIRGCSFHRIRQAICLTRFSRPYKTTVPDITIDDCHYSGDCGPYWQQGHASAGVRSPMMPEMRSNAGWITPPNWGNVTIENCTGQWNGYSLHRSFFTLNGPMNSVTIRDCDITDTGTMIQIGQVAGAGTLPITITGCRKRASTSAGYVPLTQSDCSFSGSYTLSFTPAAS